MLNALLPTLLQSKSAAIAFGSICDQMDRALGAGSEGLGFDSYCKSCAEVSGKIRIPHCLGPPTHNGYLVHRSKFGSIVAGCYAPLPGEVKSAEHVSSHGYLDSKQIPLHLPLPGNLNHSYKCGCFLLDEYAIQCSYC